MVKRRVPVIKVCFFEKIGHGDFKEKDINIKYVEQGS